MSLAAGLLARERRATRALLKAERAALRELRSAVQPVAQRAALSVAGAGADARDAMVAVRRTVPVLRQSLERAVLDARGRARRAGRDDLRLSDGIRRRSAGAEEDAAAAHAAASSYAAAWGAAAISGVLGQEETGAGTLAAALSHEPLDYRLRRIAATETARAFNAERASIMREHHAPAAGVFQIWSSVLDRRTCAYCFDQDGRTLELHARFGRAPPVHVNCRCVVLYVSVPHPERLEDIALDYDAFKAEMRDIVRERHVASDRHARPFVTASMGRDRSPVALTRKFRSLAH